MTITSFFSDILNAPVVNKMWSWGSENERNVFIRANYRDITKIDRSKGYARTVIQITYDGVESLGAKERLNQLASIQNGKQGFVVMVYGQIGATGKFKIDSFDKERIWPIEELIYDATTNTHYAVLGHAQTVSSLIQE